MFTAAVPVLSAFSLARAHLASIEGLMTGALIDNLLAGAMAYSFYRNGIGRRIVTRRSSGEA